MDIKHMRYFVAIVKYGSMTGASNHLYISQPTISKAIQDIETELGMSLFDRTKKKIALTDAGSVFFDQCEEILRLHSELPNDLKNMIGMRQGHIKIGLPPIMDAGKLMAIIKDFHDLYPKITFQLIESGSRTIESRLIQNEIDIGITVLPTESDRFDNFNFISESLCLVVHENHQLAPSPSVNLEELKYESFIMFNEDFYLNEIITSACKNAGFIPAIISKTSQWNFIEEMIERELGVCIMPESVAKLLKSSSVTVKIEEPVLKWRLGVIWNKDKYINFITEEWLKFFQQHYS
ncbi:LysR family transcriptional regulator [Salinicoccus halodurans]|uniref:LysR family transcriptional regulator n=1 Tax=Salinicoccus halodurans TaxID=407035 RepID=A0ABN4G9Z2_9STAP|nr:LysR family transcriptional regulator [Salinicoccus halodurans]AKG75210.1 LysR family transcriptional regulator [Salinicoccus halodurans]